MAEPRPQKVPLGYSWGAPGALAGGQSALAPVDAVFSPSTLFSPGEPVVPADRQRTRTWDFPVGYNLVYTPREFGGITFEELRALGQYDLVRLAVETRKDQIEKLDWRIGPRDEDDVRGYAKQRAAAATEFWRSPDGERPFASWLRELLEDLLVIDAPACEVRRNRGGEVIGLDVIDGATIKVLVDDTGRRPKPPAPAYEQVIHGRPWRLLTSDELLYEPRNRRPAKVYGFSPVEQIVLTINTGLRRAVMQLSHFTESNVPAGLLNAPDGWNAEQIRQFQEWFDSVLSGSLADRTKLVWGPAGAKYQPFREAPYKDDFDEWLARVVCYAFSLPPTPFIGRNLNRSSSETLQDATLNEGLVPLMAWVKRLVDGVLQRRLGHDDLEFSWRSADDDTSPLDQMQIISGYVKAGLKTRNEARAMVGDPPLDGGDELTVDTAQGPVPVKRAAEPAPADAAIAEAA